MASVVITTSQTSTTTKVSPNIHFDPTYFRTIPGILKVLEAVLSLVGFICIQSMAMAIYSSSGWYSFVSMTGFWISLILLVFYVFHIVERLCWLPWLMIEMGFAGIWSVFFFIAACVAASKAGSDHAWGAAAFFGFAAMCVYGYEGYIKYVKWRSGDIAQGERETTVTSSTVTTGPSYPTY